MMTTDGSQLLAELDGSAARAWEAYADANGVTVGALLTSLGSILRYSGADDVRVRELLLKAVAGAR